MFENSIRLATRDPGLKSTGKIWIQAQQAKLVPVVASAELSHCLPCIALAYTSQPCQKGQHILMLRGTLYVRKEHQLAFLNLLLAKESNCEGQLGRRGVKRPEVSCSFFFPPSTCFANVN